MQPPLYPARRRGPRSMLSRAVGCMDLSMLLLREVTWIVAGSDFPGMACDMEVQNPGRPKHKEKCHLNRSLRATRRTGRTMSTRIRYRLGCFSVGVQRVRSSRTSDRRGEQWTDLEISCQLSASRHTTLCVTMASGTAGPPTTLAGATRSQPSACRQSSVEHMLG